MIDLSTYVYIRRNEDKLSKQIPERLIDELKEDQGNNGSKNNKDNPKDLPNNKNNDVIKKLSKGGNTVVLIHKVRESSPYRNWGFNNIYRDSNNNRVMDINDVGYVTPGSTIKVLIAYCLYKNKNPNNQMERIVKRALVVSDNTAANKMIEWLGGVKEVQKCFDEEGFKNTYINRMFGSSKSITKRGCKEGSIYGNCTTAETLVKVLEYLVDGNNALGLFLSDDKRIRIVSILSLRPSDIGSNEPDDYCAFIKAPGPQKCGVALLDTSISNLAYIPDKGLVVFVGYRGSNKVNDSQMSKVIDSIYRIGLEGARNER